MMKDTYAKIGDLGCVLTLPDEKPLEVIPEKKEESKGEEAKEADPFAIANDADLLIPDDDLLFDAGEMDQGQEVG